MCVIFLKKRNECECIHVLYMIMMMMMIIIIELQNLKTFDLYTVTPSSVTRSGKLDNTAKPTTKFCC